jgi:hypothetical protein
MLTEDEVEALLPDDILVCNCAECRRLLFGRLTYTKAASFLTKLGAPVSLPPARVAGRIHDRPLCGRCIEPGGRFVGKIVAIARTGS